MLYLLLVSLIWAFSFGLIKGNLAGVDSNFVAFARIAIAFLVFLPFTKFRKLHWKTALKLGLTGLIQFGVMYITYLAAFKTLKAYEVALFTIFTPVFVTLFEDAFTRKFNPLHLLTAVIAVIGTWIIEYQVIQSPGVIRGFLLVQASNICYAFGQIYYRRVMSECGGMKDREVFGILYLGALMGTAITTAILVPVSTISLDGKQIWTLVYLGAIASGISFFLWNVGARRVNAGALAIFNNLKIPLAITVSLLVFKEQTNLIALLLGGAIILCALLINEFWGKHQAGKRLSRTKNPLV